jgi:hypothetical protein
LAKNENNIGDLIRDEVPMHDDNQMQKQNLFVSPATKVTVETTSDGVFVIEKHFNAETRRFKHNYYCLMGQCRR